jgi:sporulation protein YlmC with PRC-barrel domain
LKASELVNREVFVESFKVGTVKDIVFDAEEWKVSHLEIQLTKEAAEEFLGAKKSVLNIMAISAVGQPTKCCTSQTRVDVQVSRGQLRIYLRPP